MLGVSDAPGDVPAVAMNSARDIRLGVMSRILLPVVLLTSILTAAPSWQQRTEAAADQNRILHRPSMMPRRQGCHIRNVHFLSFAARWRLNPLSPHTHRRGRSAPVYAAPSGPQGESQ